jgi:radical SAM superfamily enzyme YgiQ (UPF0313 family)
MKSLGDWMADIILFNPSLGYFNKVVKALPLSLLSISRFLHTGYKIKIIDQTMDKNWKKLLKKEVKKGLLCFGTTAMTGTQIKYALEASEIVKYNSNVPVVWGGVHPTLLPEQTLNNENIDFVIRGEGEISFYNLICALDDDKQLNKIKGLCFKENGKIKKNPSYQFLDLNTLPAIPYHLINVRKYLKFSAHNFGKTVHIETGRGCPHRCTFCYSTSFNMNRRRCLSAKSIVDEIRYFIDKFDVDNVFFVDDNFFIEKGKVLEMSQEIIEQRLDITWCCEADLHNFKNFDSRCIKILEKSGLKWVGIGVESGSPHLLRLMKKKIKIKDVINVNKRLRKYDILLRFNFMLGYPTETIADIKRTTKLILKLLKENPNTTIQPLYASVPYPGTEFYDLAVSLGFEPPKRLEGWIEFLPEKWINKIPWVDKKRKRMLKILYLSSMFIDNKMDINTARNAWGMLLRIFSRIYRPMAKFRIENLFSKFGFEEFLFKFISD